MMDAIVLAGGKGTRLRSVISELPKPMAPINGRPFLEYILASLSDGGFSRVVLSVGYKYETIIDHFGETFNGLKLNYAIEDKPLGTGGAIKAALRFCADDYVFVLNGDTYFAVDYRQMHQRAVESKANIFIAVKELENFDRYGLLDIADGHVKKFHEKKFCAKGFINGGVYCLRRDLLDGVMETAFSFETDFLERFQQDLNASAFESTGYFIDIGIPADYARAQSDFQKIFLGM